jgi:predicted transcriptional regulator
VGAPALRSRHLFAFSLAVVSGFAFLAAIYSREKPRDSYLASPIIIVSSSIPNMDSSNFFNQSTRMQIYSLIKNSPGIHFREICSILGFPIGTVQYHLNLLVNRDAVRVRRDGRYKRYFEAKKYSETEMQIISFLRHSAIRHIIFALHANPCTHKELTSLLGASSQALTWHMNRLRKTGLIYATAENSTVRYFLTPEADRLVKSVCSGLRGS